MSALAGAGGLEEVLAAGFFIPVLGLDVAFAAVVLAFAVGSSCFGFAFAFEPLDFAFGNAFGSGPGGGTPPSSDSSSTAWRTMALTTERNPCIMIKWASLDRY